MQELISSAVHNSRNVHLLVLSGFVTVSVFRFVEVNCWSDPPSPEKKDKTYLFECLLAVFMIQDSSVGIVTRYRLDGPGMESWSRQDFLHLSRMPLGSTQPPVQWVPGFSRG